MPILNNENLGMLHMFCVKHNQCLTTAGLTGSV